MPDPADAPDHPYDRDAIFQQDGPFSPSFMREAVRCLLRALPLDDTEPQAWQDRRMHSALLSLSALNPRDEIEVMLGVQAIAAYHAAAACWRLGMNLHSPNGESTRHVTTAATAARTFDTMLRALERRQTKPLTVPIGRPASRTWAERAPSLVIQEWAERCRETETAGFTRPADPLADWASGQAGAPAADGMDDEPVWTDAALALAETLIESERTEEENDGLDIANTDGILPSGGMVVMENPTPQQIAYMGRRLGLMYRREIEDNRRLGIDQLPRIRPIRPGDRIP